MMLQTIRSTPSPLLVVRPHVAARHLLLAAALLLASAGATTGSIEALQGHGSAPVICPAVKGAYGTYGVAAANGQVVGGPSCGAAS